MLAAALSDLLARIHGHLRFWQRLLLHIVVVIVLVFLVGQQAAARLQVHRVVSPKKALALFDPQRAHIFGREKDLHIIQTPKQGIGVRFNFPKISNLSKM